MVRNSPNFDGRLLQAHSLCSSRRKSNVAFAGAEAQLQRIGPSPTCSSSATVLLIEDDEDLRSVFSQALRASGLTVLTAQDSVQAFELAQRHADEVRLILSDIILPGANGYELTRRLRAAIPGVKALFVSGHGDDRLRALGIDTVGEKVLAKPFRPQQLVATVHEVLELSSRSPT
jgi:DNA-binding response OmpR family regulator